MPGEFQFDIVSIRNTATPADKFGTIGVNRGGTWKIFISNLCMKLTELSSWETTAVISITTDDTNLFFPSLLVMFAHY
jgi:hypothetical protein